MASKQFHWIPYSIIATILVTIVVQFYWNYNNFIINKQRVTNDIRISLDNALEEYYADIAKTDFLTIIKSDVQGASWTNRTRDSIEISQLTIGINDKNKSDSLLLNIKEELNSKLLLENKKPLDSIRGYTQLLKHDKGFHYEHGKAIEDVRVLKGKKAFDSLKVLQKSLGTILISMERDTLEYKKIDSLLTLQFKQKNITTNHSLLHYKRDSLFHNSNPKLDLTSALSVSSKSTYLKPSENIYLKFQNPYKDAIKLSFSGILISLLLSIAIITCLLYLLHIIKHQKQLAEVKNDLISNITHEFKTPIATISVALESIKNFNALESKEKTMTYLDMSSDQLTKLNVMVEKLLETSTLDSENLVLNKDCINITKPIEQLVEKHNMQKEGKPIRFVSTPEIIMSDVDAFHFENAINNILDNAVKYGGDDISVEMIKNKADINISISDSGTSLNKNNKDHIFEKFYRVPKGNTHDIKGFGIGLYYTKKIIEKHDGSIQLLLKNNATTFQIILPNG